MNLPPIAASIVNRPKPKLPDRMLPMQEYMDYVDDLACWKADQAERYMAGVYED